MLQPAAAKRPRTDVHGGPGSQRWRLTLSLNGKLIPPFQPHSLPVSFRLQQDVQSATGPEPADNQAAPSSLHPHRSHTHTPTHRLTQLQLLLSDAGASMCRLLHPGVSAGTLPSLCQHQAAGDALPLPLPLR